MATIMTVMQVQDNMTRALRNISGAVGTLIESMERAHWASQVAIDRSALSDARTRVALVTTEFDAMEREIRQAADAQEKFNDKMRQGQTAAGGLGGAIKGFIGKLGSLYAIKEIAGLSDTMAATTARLNLIVDDGGSVAELENKIMASAQRSRASYIDTAASVAKLGLVAHDAFGNNDELIRFSELINKNFVIGGAGASEQRSARLQLTQALGSGRLQGDEYRSIIENAPLLANSIEDYMRNVRGMEGAMKDWAAQGLLTTEVIKAAVFSSADEVEERFSQMSLTWGQVLTMMGNSAITFFRPVLKFINLLANHLATIGPVLGGLAAAFAVFQIAAHWTQIATAATAAYTAVTTFLSLGYAVLTGAAEAATMAQTAYNAALLANPVTWFFMALFAVVGVLTALVRALDVFGAKSHSVIGTVAGLFAAAGAFILNSFIGAISSIIQLLWSMFVRPFMGIIEFVLNTCNGGFNTFGDWVANLIGQIIGWFLSLGKVVTTIIDAIFGTDWTAGLTELQNKVTAWGKNEKAISFVNEMDPANYLSQFHVDYQNAFTAGANLGDAFSGWAFSSAGIDYSDTWNDIYSNTDAIAGGVKGIGDSLDISQEDLRYLRDIAEREAINRFTTAEVKIDMTGMTNRIDSNMDLDGVITGLTGVFAEALETAAEGVHA